MIKIQEIKSEYIALLASGMFWEFFPHLTGIWNDDKDMFIEYYIKKYN